MKTKIIAIFIFLFVLNSFAGKCPNLKVQLEAEIQLSSHLKKLTPSQILNRLDEDKKDGKLLKLYHPYLFADSYPLGNQYLVCWSMLKGALEGEEQHFQEEIKAWTQCLKGLDKGKLKLQLPACLR